MQAVSTACPREHALSTAGCVRGAWPVSCRRMPAPTGTADIGKRLKRTVNKCTYSLLVLLMPRCLESPHSFASASSALALVFFFFFFFLVFSGAAAASSSAIFTFFFFFFFTSGAGAAATLAAAAGCGAE